MVGLAAIACGAMGVILLLGGAYVAMQFGPGGLMSDVRSGSPAPQFDVPALSDGTIRLEDYDGQLVALNFWATWCPPCVEELPMLVEAEARHADEGLAVVALNAGQTRAHIPPRMF